MKDTYLNSGHEIKHIKYNDSLNVKTDLNVNFYSFCHAALDSFPFFLSSLILLVATIHEHLVCLFFSRRFMGFAKPYCLLNLIYY